MIVRSYLTGVGVTTALTLAAWLLTLFYFDPNTSGMVGVILFFVSLTITVIGLLTLGVYAVQNRWLQGEKLVFFSRALRYGIMVGIIIAGMLLLKTLWILTWWNAGMLILAGVVLEIYFQVK